MGLVALRSFAIQGHEVGPNGPIILNDLTGGSGRVDVLARAVNTALLRSHSIREDSNVILHLSPDEWPRRRMRIQGSDVRGLPADERGISGHIKKATSLVLPPEGHWEPISPGIEHSGGGLEHTLAEWKNEGRNILCLDAKGVHIEGHLTRLPFDGTQLMGFLLSDHLPFTDVEQALIKEEAEYVSVGREWLQGHAVVAIVQHIMDEYIATN